MQKTTLRKLSFYLFQYKKSLFFIIISAILSVIASLIGPFFIGRAIDNMVGPSHVNFDALITILFILVGVFVIGSLFLWLLTYLSNLTANLTVNHIRKDLYHKINTLPLSFYDQNPHGDSISRFVNDMDNISEGLVQSYSVLFTGIVTIVGAIGFMAYINLLMTIVVLCSAPVSYYVAKRITKRSQSMFKSQVNTLGVLNGYVEEILSGQKIVQAFCYEKPTYERFEKINQELYHVGVKSQFYGSLSNPSTRLVNNITYSIIGVVGSILAILGKITVGDITSFLIYSNLFAKPFNEITGVFTVVQSALASAQRIFEILEMESTEQPQPEANVISYPKGEITFKNVWFSYQPGTPLIQDFSLELHPGTKVAIVGQTGAGKTTLVNLLMRFYEINSGEILLDQVDIRSLDKDNLRRHFGMVLQETWLFEGTIRENIAFGRPTASDDEIIAAAKAAEAHNFIMKLPQGYDTLLSQAGDNISQGQKQLLTIARVMLVEPPILILDEATSSIDTRTELHIQKAFLKMIDGRTSFIIAHRLSTIKEADMILVMEKGNVVESGSHHELLQKKGYYHKLYNSQYAPV